MKRLLALVVFLITASGCATTPERSGVVLQMPHPMSSAQGIDQFYVSPAFNPTTYAVVEVAEPQVAVPITDHDLLYTDWSRDLRTALAQALRDTGMFAKVVETSTADVTQQKTLIVESAIVEMDPGSQLARWFFGEFGAGNTFLEIEGRFVEADTQTVLVQFADRRRGAAIFDPLGGKSVALLREDLQGIAKDAAKALRDTIQTNEGRR